jgi:hypothetical protein
MPEYTYCGLIRSTSNLYKLGLIEYDDFYYACDLAWYLTEEEL